MIKYGRSGPNVTLQDWCDHFIGLATHGSALPKAKHIHPDKTGVMAIVAGFEGQKHSYGYPEGTCEMTSIFGQKIKGKFNEFSLEGE